jgi:hypothetical protein
MNLALEESTELRELQLVAYHEVGHKIMLHGLVSKERYACRKTPVDSPMKHLGLGSA